MLSGILSYQSQRWSIKKLSHTKYDSSWFGEVIMLKACNIRGGKILHWPFSVQESDCLFSGRLKCRLKTTVIYLTGNVKALANNPTIIRDPLTVEGAQFKITTLLDKHARGYGKGYGSWNIIFVLEAGGIRFCHWGDNRADISPEQISALGRIDGLTVPVDGSKHLLEFEEVDEVIERLKPKVVFPTHYFIEGLNSPDCELEGISTWLAQQPRVKSMVSDSINLAFSTLPEVTEVWVFESISKKRYAKGEISKEEFKKMKKDLET